MRAALAIPVLLVLGGCVAPNPDITTPGSSAIPPFGFAAPVTIDPNGSPSEPSILATRDGSLYVVGPLGSASTRGDGLWKSTDGGATWRSLGLPDYPFGGGDADIAEDEAGTLYLPGQWRPGAVPPQCYITAGESMAVSRDGGATWTVNPVASDSPVVDRQWVATYKTGIVYLAFNQAQRGLVVTKSTDSGLTWAQLAVVPDTWDSGPSLPCGDIPAALATGGPNGIAGNILVDPTDGTLLIPYAPALGTQGGVHRLFLSKDGRTFEARTIHASPAGAQPSAIFGTLARDSAGTLYYAWAEGTQAQGVHVYYAASRDRGATWTTPTPVSGAAETAVFPWIVAGGPGQVALAYYAAPGHFLSDAAPHEAEWTVKIAYLPHADVGATDASTKTLSAFPNHRGPLCTSGTGCDPQYRRLGDFFEIGLTPGGAVVAVWADDSRGGGSPTLNQFAQQITGTLL